MAKKGQAAVRAPVMTDAAVKARTGKDWDYWFAALDKAGAAKRDHKAIVKILYTKLNVGPWWGQMIAVSYERARGIRAVNQRRSGEFAVNVSRTVDAKLSKLFAAATTGRAKWFPKGAFEETSLTKDKYWRGKWKKEGRLEIGFLSKGAGKSQITVQSNKLPDAAAVETERTAWKKALERLNKSLGENGAP
jgi:hypothetical protein